MSSTPPRQESPVPRPLSGGARAVRRAYHGLPPRVRRELLIYGVALLCGLLLVPVLIWFAGNRVLGPYTHGQNPHAGPFALLADFYLSLAHGSAVFWVVALGPAGLLLLGRLLVSLVRVMPRDPPRGAGPTGPSAGPPRVARPVTSASRATPPRRT
jgi:hypothetical protein